MAYRNSDELDIFCNWGWMKENRCKYNMCKLENERE
jgi:hypothetical protein